jgi:hypothetical protein
VVHPGGLIACVREVECRIIDCKRSDFTGLPQIEWVSRCRVPSCVGPQRGSDEDGVNTDHGNFIMHGSSLEGAGCYIADGRYQTIPARAPLRKQRCWRLFVARNPKARAKLHSDTGLTPPLPSTGPCLLQEATLALPLRREFFWRSSVTLVQRVETTYSAPGALG